MNDGKGLGILLPLADNRIITQKDSECDCPVCRRFSRAYVRHLFTAGEMLGMRLAVMHNLYFYNKLAERIRDALDAGEFAQFRAAYSEKLAEKI